MTVYLAYLVGVGAVVGLLGLTHAPTWLVFLLLPLPLLFHRFESKLVRFPRLNHESHRTRLATGMGVVFGTLGVLGFVVAGFLGETGCWCCCRWIRCRTSSTSCSAGT